MLLTPLTLFPKLVTYVFLDIWIKLVWVLSHNWLCDSMLSFFKSVIRWIINIGNHDYCWIGTWFTSSIRTSGKILYKIKSLLSSVFLLHSNMLINSNSRLFVKVVFGSLIKFRLLEFFIDIKKWKWFFTKYSFDSI